MISSCSQYWYFLVTAEQVKSHQFQYHLHLATIPILLLYRNNKLGNVYSLESSYEILAELSHHIFPVTFHSQALQQTVVCALHDALYQIPCQGATVILSVTTHSVDFYYQVPTRQLR